MDNHLPKANAKKPVDVYEASTDEPPHQLTSRANDPFFADISTYTGDAPSDLSVKHDEYLYDDLA